MREDLLPAPAFSRRDCIAFISSARCQDFIIPLIVPVWGLEGTGEGVGVKPKPYDAHPTAVIDRPCEIGQGTRIWHHSHVMPEARIGRNCILGQNVFVGRGVMIGNGVKIQNNVSVYEGVELEDFVFCGPSAVFTNVFNPRSEVERKKEFRRTFVRRGATIGANATILCGITVGRYSFIGAGAVVTKDVPDFAQITGVPGRISGWRCECGEALRWVRNRARCARCGKTFTKIGNRVASLQP